MRCLLLLPLICLVALVLAGCNTSGGTLTYNQSNPPLPANTYALPPQFVNSQGNEGWSYYQATPDQQDYALLTWGDAPAGAMNGITQCWWSGTLPSPVIAYGLLCPAVGHDAVIGWQVAKSGTVQVSAAVQSQVTNAAGDGVLYSVWLNDACITQPIQIPNSSGQTQTPTAIHTMNAGDMLYLRFSAGQESASDWLSYVITVKVN